jgi:hypothetical protein
MPRRSDMGRSQAKHSSPHLSDEELEYYGELYLHREIRAAGVEFEHFLANPEYYLAKYPERDARRDGDGHRRKGILQFLRLRPAARTPSR